MRAFIFFAIVFTLAELAFSTCYFLIVKRVDTTLCIGIAIYIACMLTAYRGIRFIRYQEKRKALLDSLLNP